MSDENITWLDDKVGRDASGLLVLKVGDGGMLFTATEETLYSSWDKARRFESDLQDAQKQINARQPHLWVQFALKELETRGKEADKLRAIEGGAGKIMRGQAQAYNDAAALLRSFVE